MVDPRTLGAEDRALVAGYWWRRAAGEMTSWVGWQHVLEDLTEEGAPEAVLALARRAVGDEHQHACWCRDWAVRFGHPGGEVQPRSTQRIALAGASALENRLLRITLSCFTETVGAFTLKHVRDVVTDPELRRLNQRHLADELHHSRVGWAYLSLMDGARRDLVRRLTPALLGLLPRACCEGDELPREDLVPFGYFTPALLRRAHDEAVAEVVLPGLVHLGITEAA